MACSWQQTCYNRFTAIKDIVIDKPEVWAFMESGLDLRKNGKRKFDVFRLIAPVYGLFYNHQRVRFIAALEKTQAELGLSAYKSIVDIGCGTGALCSVLHQQGFCVTGVEQAKEMLDVAKRKNPLAEIRFVQANVLEKLPFENKSFDVSIASYVAHGLKEVDRKIMYAEMNRISKRLVIIMDYNENRSVLTNIIEWLERGDYFNFIHAAQMELEACFRDIRMINVSSRGAWYICTPKEISDSQVS
jgi:ubiquinone/menaquinone biosynthesis C-methylase UbiE